jgi:hypothetical protein
MPTHMCHGTYTYAFASHCARLRPLSPLSVRCPVPSRGPSGTKLPLVGRGLMTNTSPPCALCLCQSHTPLHSTPLQWSMTLTKTQSTRRRRNRHKTSPDRTGALRPERQWMHAVLRTDARGIWRQLRQRQQGDAHAGMPAGKHRRAPGESQRLPYGGCSVSRHRASFLSRGALNRNKRQASGGGAPVGARWSCARDPQRIRRKVLRGGQPGRARRPDQRLASGGGRLGKRDGAAAHARRWRSAGKRQAEAGTGPGAGAGAGTGARTGGMLLSATPAARAAAAAATAGTAGAGAAAAAAATGAGARAAGAAATAAAGPW